MTRLRVLLLLLVFAAVLGVSSSSLAQPKAPSPAAPPDQAQPAPVPGGLDVDSLAKWLERYRKDRCTENCYFLERLTLRGSVSEGIDFELEGGVLAPAPVAVPLFGPPGKARLVEVTEDGKKAAVGFSSDHYFVWTGAKRFVLRGQLILQGDLSLTIPGPLNTLEAELASGRVAEGSRLSGLAKTSIHFDVAAEGDKKQPPVFQLARALRVGKETSFEYRLSLQSGSDIGLVRLPLRFGERVLDVSGASGWKTEGADLVLPTSGTTARITVTGKLEKLGAFMPDERSAYEWWLLESDPEHRLSVAGDARQVDVQESPIARSQPNARLYLVQKGQRIEVGVNTLVATEVLAAVVRSHNRTLVLTRQGDLVSDDVLAYENNGIDYLRYSPVGRPIYLATDDVAERIMHAEGGTGDVLVPLRVGSHRIRSQAIGQAGMGTFGGMMQLPAPSYPLTSSHTALTVGLPAQVFPVLLIGGDAPQSPIDFGDALAVVIGFVVAAIAFRSWRTRITGGLVLAGLWAIAGWMFALVVIALVIGGAMWLLGRVLTARALVAARIALGGLLALSALVSVVGALATLGSRGASGPRSDVAEAPGAPAPSYAPASATDKLGNRAEVPMQNAREGILQGVTPVALTLPGYERSISAHRELVTRDRPFHARLIYVTWWTVAGLLGAWLGCVGLLIRQHMTQLKDAWRAVRTRLQRTSPSES